MSPYTTPIAPTTSAADELELPLCIARIFGGARRAIKDSRADLDAILMHSRHHARMKTVSPYLRALAIVAGATVAAFALAARLAPADLAMVYLLGVVVAAREGRGPALLASALSVLLFDFLFVPPVFTLAVANAQYLSTFIVMLVVGFTIGHLAELGRREARRSREREVEIEAERFRNVLLSSISHDLRTPLATIIGAASALREDAEARIAPDQRRALLDSLLGEAERMHRLVGNLLDVSRFSAGRIEIARAPVALDELVAVALARLEDALGERPLKLDFAPELPLVAGDEVMLEQVLVNLVENAIKHTAAGTALEISASAEGGRVVVAVRDHGAGLEPGREERLFDKFERGPHASRDGIGLGLAICKNIVEAHGGTIRARNATGGGAEFRVELPVLAA
jgi:K+-sensing histidine kinase KdpD